MLHEVIITLSGFKGELLHNLDTCVDLKDFLHLSERTLLRKILEIAKNYKYLKDFIEINQCAIFGDEDHELQALSGLYIQAFCEGLSEALEPYRREIHMLEQNVLIGPNVTLIYIFSQVDKYASIFVLLTSLVDQVLSRKVHGCQILQLLYENNLIAVDHAKDYLECILKQCHVVFLRQTMNWLMNGDLSDPFNEYVIRKASQKTESVDESDDTSLLSLHKKNLVDTCSTDDKYEVAINFVPIYINYSFVNDILFVGQIVRILNENPRNNFDFNHLDENLIFGEKEKHFFDQFALLVDEMSLDMKELEVVVREVRECVVQHLWRVAVEEENLYEELQLLKNFYLLGFGQFFRDFLLEASAFSLHSSRSPFSQDIFTDLNETMSGVACSFPQIDDKVLSTFSFKIQSSKCKDTSKTSDTIWSSIKLQYIPKWPLNLIFTPVAIEHYNKLFLFLLRVKRCHIEIHNVWKNDIKNKNLRCGKAWELRNELMFLINNLQFYLQVDVIETEYNKLINEIHKVKDFQQIEKLHNIFLLNVLSHSFLLDVSADDMSTDAAAPATYSKHFYNVLLNNIKICEKFCLLASKGSLENREKEIGKLNKSFQKYKNIFLCFLSEYQSQPFKQHAGKFLLRLNFNNWVN